MQEEGVSRVGSQTLRRRVCKYLIVFQADVVLVDGIPVREWFERVCARARV
jgi:hypothetical protein